MKNRIIYIFIVATAVLISSCNKWLDVKPKSQVDRKDMFKTEDGFKDALIGCYIGLKDNNLYGNALTMSTIEYLAALWDYDATTTAESLTKHDYTNNNVISKLDAIHSALYNVIVRANDLLAAIDENKLVFRNENLKLMIKAEAIAIRAFCHLDVLRLYGPVPRNLTIATNNKLAYVKEVTYEPLDRCTYEQYIALLENDLMESATLLQTIDPITMTKSESDEVIEDEPFMSYRKFRFNYYAVEALKARFYLYTQQNEKAYNCAINIIEAKDENGDIKFKLAVGKDYTSASYTLPSEHLLSLNVFDLRSKVDGFFKTGDSRVFLRKDEAKVKTDIYENSVTDNRLIKGWEYVVITGGVKNFTLNKYFQPGDNDDNDSELVYTNKQIISLIRLSEIYLIAMEAGSIAKCNELAETYFQARSLPMKQLTDHEREAELLKEYRKDFYAEGQIFFTYKRFASTSMLWAPSAISLESYIIPMPLSDITYEK